MPSSAIFELSDSENEATKLILFPLSSTLHSVPPVNNAFALTYVASGGSVFLQPTVGFANIYAGGETFGNRGEAFDTYETIPLVYTSVNATAFANVSSTRELDCPSGLGETRRSSLPVPLYTSQPTESNLGTSSSRSTPASSRRTSPRYLFAFTALCSFVSRKRTRPVLTHPVLFLHPGQRHVYHPQAQQHRIP